MGRDSWKFRRVEEERQKQKRIKPIWRGVGCLLIVVLGIVGYVFTGWFLRQGIIYIPPFILEIPILPDINGIVIVQLVIAFLFVMLSYAILSAIYAMAFPIRPGELDAPPMKRSDTKKRW